MAATILVADHEPGICDMLVWELTDRGFEVVAARDSVSAAAALAATEFDIVLSDVNMPGIDCLAVIEASKRLAPETEVVIATHPRDLQDALACVRGGAFDYVEKPFDLSNLVVTLRRALERRQLRARRPRCTRRAARSSTPTSRSACPRRSSRSR